MSATPLPAERLRRLRLVVFDVDGVITDGRIWHGADGAEWRCSSVRDGLGIKLLRGAGITPAIISGRPAGGLGDRLRNLGIEHLYFGNDDKLPLYRTLAHELGIADDEAAMMGDDLPDLALFEATGLGLCPSDAHPAVRAAAHWTSQFPGGGGAIREFADLVAAARSPA